MKKKAITTLLSLAFILLALVGCSGAEESNSASDGEKTIEFMHLWPEGSSAKHNKIVSDIVADFESQNEGITVDVEVLSNEQYKDKIKVLATSDELPDVGLTWAAGYLKPYVEAGQFAPLDDLLEGELADSFVSGTTEPYAIDGSTYGLPLELNVANIFYNKAIFEEYGLEAPETYEDLKNVITTLKENEVAPIALGNKDSWTGSMWYMYFADRIGGSEALTKAISGDGSFEDPALVKAAEKVQELADMGAFIRGTNGISDQEAKSMFMNEQAAMYLIATWDLPNYTTNEQVPQEFRDSVGYFKFPTVNGNGDKDSFVGGPGVGMFVAENSDVKAEAKEFVSFFIKEWGEKSVKEAGVIPATKVDAESMELPQMYVNVLNDLNNASNLTLFADVQMNPDAAQVHLDQIQALFGGEVTPEQFAEAHEEALSKQE
ncbi:ABC transporter substrate-binding protein [Halobacillus amylolyticus]|uniref:Extracellular solute-binding protein n=1 Tax=Halobacillus amylolyticus TaxID=2932259 RepID=A0ABY4H9Z4_9BACI|nr:extracellular solute-binding protein [Halobacillus amylolyticus]UOR11434.1 extracellular solute-binding protein [Halobacillus amylolyticus]